MRICAILSISLRRLSTDLPCLSELNSLSHQQKPADTEQGKPTGSGKLGPLPRTRVPIAEFAHLAPHLCGQMSSEMQTSGRQNVTCRPADSTLNARDFADQPSGNVDAPGDSALPK
ncbi:uncharacterized protein DEA37_0005489 [Paragonimus westermani]|uniref:Uncharacterized protein n=1 Tax=Paragonimus westermani TaxID=34504 RepID=A0A5J4NN59_9TREM|nr:uncharacterized protein DEA37_0005489 [Paragonimus westermani]